MSTPRAVLVEQLGSLLGLDVVVEPYARNVDTVSVDTVMVAQDTVRPSAEVARLMSKASTQVREYAFQLWLIVPQTLPGPADDELDMLLEDVLKVLDDADNMRWTEARRGVFEPTQQPAYVITAPTIVRAQPEQEPTP